MSAFAPKSHLTSAVWNWAPKYKEVVQQVMDGTWKSGSMWWGIETGAVGLAPFGDMVPQNVRDDVEARKAKMIAGEYEVFDGPIKDQDGNLKVAEGEHLTDEEMLGITWFVEGVIGTTE
jgi:basic membrane protein A